MTSIRSARSSSVLRPSIVAVLVALLLVPVGADAQRPQFRSRVELVQFQVRVTDGSGNFVPGLQASDFTLRVNGRDRAITTVYEVNLGDGSEAPAAAASQPPAAWRQWVLFFDAAFNSPRGVFAAQEAAQHFITEQVHPRDLVGVATYNIVAGARLVVPPTRDHRQVLAAINGLGLNSATQNTDRAGFLAQTLLDSIAGLDSEEAAGGTVAEVAEGGPPEDVIAQLVQEMARQVASMELDRYTGEVSRFTQQLGTIGDVLRMVRGRKHVVFFSEGFADSVLTGASLDQLASVTDDIQQDAGLALANSSGDEMFGSSEVRERLDDAMSAFRASDAVIHVVDPSGVGGGRDLTGISSQTSQQGDFAARGDSRSALTALASSTGGEMHWETNDLTGALAEIEEANRNYYVLAFPREGAAEMLELDVEVARAGLRVDAPEELAPARPFGEMSELERQLQLAEFVSKGIVEPDLVFDVATAGFYGDATRSRLPVVIEVPWEQLVELADSGADEKINLEIYTYALDEQDRMIDLSNREVNLDMGSMKGSRTAGLPFRYYDLLWATPGARKVRVILRDKELGRISSHTSPTTVIPQYGSGAVALSGPIGVDWDHPGLIMRGFNADSPPPHKAGGPVAYPFAVGTEEVTPTAALSGAPGSEHYVYFVAHNLGRDPAGAPQTMVALALQDPMGQPQPLPGQQMIAQQYEEAIDGTHMLAKGTLPPNLAPGQYTLMVMINDQIKGAQAVATIPVWVTGS